MLRLVNPLTKLDRLLMNKKGFCAGTVALVLQLQLIGEELDIERGVPTLYGGERRR